METVRLCPPRPAGRGRRGGHGPVSAGPRALRGHPWVYRNEIERLPSSLPPGALVEVADWRGRFVGRGYANPHSEITIRLLTREPEAIDEAFIRRRLDQAIALRRQWYPKAEAVRLVFSEADGLPGLIVDRYGEALVVQITTAGMEALKPLVVSALLDLIRPAALIERSDLPVRRREGLEPAKGLLHGHLQGPIQVRQHGLDLEVNLLDGQKTGLYLDQADNYLAARLVAEGRRVLDLFCYGGAWALHAAAAGAVSVEGLDSSARAIEWAKQTAERNGLAERCTFRVADIFDELPRLERTGARYDLIILDPPAFARGPSASQHGRRLEQIAAALRGHKELHRRALQLLAPGGILITCCCSHLVSPEAFEATLDDAARDTRRTVRLLERRGQAKDHPVILGIPETAYLTCTIIQAA